MGLIQKLVPKEFGDSFQDTVSLLDNFRTDAVTGQEDNVGFQKEISGAGDREEVSFQAANLVGFPATP